jgi:hypothetical protein
MDCRVPGRGVVQNARSCSIEIARDGLDGCEGAVLGRVWLRLIFSLADRLGKNGLDSFRLSSPGVEGVNGRGGGSLPAPALASPTMALHDLARLRILRRRPSLWWVGSAGVLGCS